MGTKVVGKEISRLIALDKIKVMKDFKKEFDFLAPFVSPLERNRSSDTLGQFSLQSGGSQSNSRTNTLDRQTPKNFPESLQKNSTIQEVKKKFWSLKFWLSIRRKKSFLCLKKLMLNDNFLPIQVIIQIVSFVYGWASEASGEFRIFIGLAVFSGCPSIYDIFLYRGQRC